MINLKNPKIRNFFTLASFLSYSRVLFVIPIFMLYGNTYAVVILIALAAITDGLDGFIARKTNTASEEGAFIDGLCDKLFFVPVFILVVLNESVNLLGIITLFLRDALVFLLYFVGLIMALFDHRIFEFRRKTKSTIFGKITTVIIFISLFWLLFNLPFVNYLFLIILIFSVISVIDYYSSFYKLYRELKNK